MRATPSPSPAGNFASAVPPLCGLPRSTRGKTRPTSLQTSPAATAARKEIQLTPHQSRHPSHEAAAKCLQSYQLAHLMYLRSTYSSSVEQTASGVHSTLTRLALLRPVLLLHTCRFSSAAAPASHGSRLVQMSPDHRRCCPHIDSPQK